MWWLLDRIRCFFGRHDRLVTGFQSTSCQGKTVHFINMECMTCGHRWSVISGLFSDDPKDRPKAGLKLFK